MPVTNHLQTLCLVFALICLVIGGIALAQGETRRGQRFLTSAGLLLLLALLIALVLGGGFHTLRL